MSKKMQLYYVDLPFAFFLSPPGEKGVNALSLITLSFHSVRLAIQPQPLTAAVAAYADGSSTTALVDSDGTADQSHKITTVVRDGQSVDVAASHGLYVCKHKGLQSAAQQLGRVQREHYGRYV